MPRTAIKPRHPEIAAELAKNGLSYTQFGRIVEANPQYVSQIIRGGAEPSDALKQRIADALGRPVAELFEMSE
jgi:transcriptional regulator with XRE-family HTH domain